MKILTFDIEDWFHILDNESTKSESEWGNFESRLSQNLDIILNLLSRNKLRATFFCVGWIANKYPLEIKRIIVAGHEIGSHTYMHQLVYGQSEIEFNEDLKRSIGTLESISGKKVRSFRAPGFSITQDTPWAFEALLRNGIEIDSSVFPASRSHGGFSSFGSSIPSIIEYKGMSLKEFPINTHTILKKDIIFSGGGYFRLFPYRIIKRFTESSPYIMTYFHPRDFDPDQPMVPGLSLSRKFKSYYGLSKTEKKLNKWVNNFKFIDISTADREIDWSNSKTIHL